MIFFWLTLISISFIKAHNPDTEKIQWAQYYRLGLVYSETPNYGIAGYSRLKRTTDRTFNDIRIFSHIFERDSEIRLRSKSSRRLFTFNKFYSFSALIYERNTIIDINLRYHYNQGIGYVLEKSEGGNTTIETGIAFDNSDYLNTVQKTTYFRCGGSVDQNYVDFSLKFEIDYYYQVSKNLYETDLSRFQILAEAKWNLKKNIGVITGVTCDINDNEPDPSLFLTVSFSNPLDWKI